MCVCVYARVHVAQALGDPYANLRSGWERREKGEEEEIEEDGATDAKRRAFGCAASKQASKQGRQSLSSFLRALARSSVKGTERPVRGAYGDALGHTRTLRCGRDVVHYSGSRKK